MPIIRTSVFFIAVLLTSGNQAESLISKGFHVYKIPSVPTQLHVAIQSLSFQTD
jgi:hypothetical protein